MINLSGIGHVLLRVTDEEASKRSYRDVLGFCIAEQHPEHGGVFMTLGDGFHTIDIARIPDHRTRRGRGTDSLGSRTSRSRSPVMRHCAKPTPTCSKTASKSSAPPIM